MKIFFVSILAFSTLCLNAQESKLDSVIRKLEKDNRSYEQFIYLGVLNCLDKNLLLENDLLPYAYGSSYNSLDPFPRLINIDSMKREFDLYEKKAVAKFKMPPTSREKFGPYHLMTCCNELYTKNKMLRKVYLNLIANKEAYNKEPEYDIEQYMDDYLKSYYIKKPNR